jgi:peptidoglycan-associated lipoprotein
MPARNESHMLAGAALDNATKEGLPKIFFTEDSTILSASEQEKLILIKQYLMAHPDTNIVIAGHASDAGTEEYNRVLGEQRAQVVRNALLKLATPRERLQTVSMGDDAGTERGKDGRCVDFGIVSIAH